MLGEEYFKVSLICKEIGEITDERSWVERQKHREENTEGEHKDVCDDLHEGHSGCVEDLGHKKNKCRLCDRRMKNKITEEAFAALNNLERGGDLVQIVSADCRSTCWFLPTTPVSGRRPRLSARSSEYVPST